MTRYGYYPGCSLHSTGAEYDHSFKAVCNSFKIELEEVPGWVCCGTSPAHASSHLLATALPIKNLALAEYAGINELVVPCAACFSRFKMSLRELSENEKLSEEIKEIIGSAFQNKVKIIHPLEVFDKMEEKNIKDAVKKNLSGMKVVCYYGCLLTRPPKVMQFDNVEYPMSMDRVMQKCGATVLDWSYKTDCCGATFSLTETDAVLKLTNKILENAKAVGANAIAVACPLCHANLDTRQAEIEEKYQTQYGLPILYFTQIMGLALGIEPKELGMKKHLVPTEPVLAAVK
ncbi:MAG: CoB--CoM heterodisulfide reductase iron-sulfur subunit B family protein [Planctomycetes bacterium]|nr:CoB--CoM heterodisulfide reductase iron-sulfur subunit B family protein [Planctomycetota bacterium]